MALLDPFRPTANDPWDFEKAAHLARRAGFGAPPERVRELVELGPAGAVDALVDAPREDPELERLIADTGGELTAFERPGLDDNQRKEALRQLWLFRMVHARDGLREKAALLWHDHFAVIENEDVSPAMVALQLELFRTLGLGSFRELLIGVARDPAMLVFLDGRVNEKQNPNENWARELLELFTLGLDRYTQADVVEVARVFTGWSTPARDAATFEFHPDAHDTGDKLVFGQRLAGRSGDAGYDEGLELLERILARPECARFVAAKLLAWFHAPDPDEALVQELAERLTAEGWSIRETLRALFGSRAFHAPEARLALVKSPVEYAVSAVRLAGLQNGHLLALSGRVRRMGMDLFRPPSVAGWEHGEAWIQTGWMIERYNLANQIAQAPFSTRTIVGAAAIDLERLLPPGDRDPRALAEALVGRVLQRELRPEAAVVVREHLREVARSLPGVSPERRVHEQARAALHLLLASPEFALC